MVNMLCKMAATVFDGLINTMANHDQTWSNIKVDHGQRQWSTMVLMRPLFKAIQQN